LQSFKLSPEITDYSSTIKDRENRFLRGTNALSHISVKWIGFYWDSIRSQYSWVAERSCAYKSRENRFLRVRMLWCI